MGLLDVLNGMQNGPRGGSSTSGGSSTTKSSGGMSPIMMAILGLLAYKAIKGVSGPAGTASPQPAPATPAGGGLGDLMRGGLGGLLGGQGGAGGLGGLLAGGLGGLLTSGAAGNVLSGGLNDLLKQFQQTGHEGTANSWVGTGSNQSITPDDLAKALSPDQLKTLIEHTGLSENELLSGLAQHLPDVINHLTPNGRLPTAQELSHLL